MNKEEIQHKLEQAKIDRNLAVIQANKEIVRLRTQLAEAEKPKLRHGDFGMWKFDPEDKPRSGIYVDNSGVKDTMLYSTSQFCSIASKDDGRDLVVLVNIFDLMKDWGEDFEEWESEESVVDNNVKNGEKVKISIRQQEIWVGTNGMECWYSEKVAYEIWRKLGHALMELKRKTNKNSAK